MSDVLTKNRVFVGGISWKADEASLANFFSTYGPVTECKIIMDRATGKSKGYGFVTFQDVEAAERVKITANFFFLGKNMNVGDAMRKGDGGDSNGSGSDNNGTGSNSNTGGRERRSQHGYSYQYYNNNYYPRQQDEYQQYYGQYPNLHNPPFYPPQQSYAYSTYSQPTGYMQSVQYQQYGAPPMQPMGYTSGQPYGSQNYQQQDSHQQSISPQENTQSQLEQEHQELQQQQQQSLSNDQHPQVEESS